jgi:hypothetical protein
MLGVGVVGAVFLGFIQDTSVEQQLLESHPQIHSEVVESKRWVLGRYDAVVPGKVTPDIAEDVAGATAIAKKEALSTVAIFPLIMLVCYLLLIFYFRSRGGYRTVDIGDDTS